jgi:shikimate dehydrogenase
MLSELRISGHTGVYAVIGDPVEHSLSPLIMNAAFAVNGIDAVYVALTVRESDALLAMQMVRAFGIRGMNVTMPLKQAIVPGLDRLSPEASLVGAVNCVFNREGILEGHNTDCTGFRLSLNSHFPQAPKTAFLLGAGGAARAIASELVRWGCQNLYLANRSRQKAEELADILRSEGKTLIQVLDWNPVEWMTALPQTNLLVNATSIGMGGDGNLETFFQWELLNRRMVIYETVYNPLETSFLRQARHSGFQALPGTELLLWQAVAGFELWTGTQAPIAAMKEKLLAELALRSQS